VPITVSHSTLATGD